MKLFVWGSGVLLSAVSYVVYATPLGWMGVPEIVSSDDVPAICLPSNAGEVFPVYRVMVSESYIKNSSYWALYLESDAEPVVLTPGSCIKFGEALNGYKLEGDLTVSKLRQNFTYSFTMDRVNDAGHYNYFYSGAFCVKRNSDGSLEYPQYSRADIPVCDGRRNGNSQK